MKSHFFLLPLLAMAPVAASAQAKPVTKAVTKPTAPSAPQISMAPAAKALLDRATATYKSAQSLSFHIAMGADGKDVGQISALFQRPNLISLNRTGPSSVRALDDGTNLYITQGATFQKDPAPKENVIGDLGIAGLTGVALGQMLDGKNPVEYFQTIYSQKPFSKVNIKTVALPARMMDGQMMSGVRSNMSFELSLGKEAPKHLSQQMTFWFGGPQTLLQRLEVSHLAEGKNSVSSEKISAQKLNPAFTPDTFKFNDAGLKLAEEPSYFDPRLKVGAEPFAFQTKTMSGETISPANYKGKVLLMDFWATWCGPCVASLPELQGAYNKYHAQGLEVVGISLDEDKDALTSFVKTNKMAWPQVFDGKGWGAEVPGIYGVKAIPFMLIIGKDGKIAAVNPRGNIDAAVKAALAAS
jgi:peroxiredoxin/outer membrane lipoprotein-sorting protein